MRRAQLLVGALIALCSCATSPGGTPSSLDPSLATSVSPLSTPEQRPAVPLASLLLASVAGLRPQPGVAGRAGVLSLVEVTRLLHAGHDDPTTAQALRHLGFTEAFARAFVGDQQGLALIGLRFRAPLDGAAAHRAVQLLTSPPGAANASAASPGVPGVPGSRHVVVSGPRAATEIIAFVKRDIAYDVVLLATPTGPRVSLPGIAVAQYRRG